MATFAVTNAYVTVGGTDLSDHVRQVSINVSAEELDDTAMGDSWHSRLGGLKDWSVTIEWNQDFAASSVDDTIWSNFGSTATIQFNPASSTTGSTNPRYSGSALISDYTPIDSSVGELATVSTTWPGAGTLTRATS